MKNLVQKPLTVKPLKPLGKPAQLTLKQIPELKPRKAKFMDEEDEIGDMLNGFIESGKKGK